MKARTKIVVRSAGSIALFSCMLFVAGCNSDKAQSPEPAAETAVYAATTNADGVGDVKDGSGKTVFTAVAADESGAPLEGLEVTYISSNPEPLVAFNDAVTGEPLGTFAVTPGSASGNPAQKKAPADGTIQTGVFILDILDIGGGRLYDPVRDGFQPVMPNTLRELRSRLSYEDVEFILSACPGIEDIGVFRADAVPAHTSDEDRIFDIYDSTVSPDDRMAAHRYARVAVWLVGRPPSYRLHLWRSKQDGRYFFVPLGAHVDPVIDSPLSGHTFTGEPQRLASVSGRLNEDPVFMTADGGHVEIYGNGALLADALSVGADGAGKTVFSTPGGLQLQPGENHLDVVAYMGEAGWGFATPSSGEVGRASVTVTYVPAEEGPEPALSGLTYTATVPGPDGSVPIGFHFRDGQADIALFHWKGSGTMNGQPISAEFEHPISALPELASMIGASEGDCSINFNYGDVDQGASVNIEIWVIDAAGHPSNHLIAHMTILASGGAPISGGPAAATFAIGDPNPELAPPR